MTKKFIIGLIIFIVVIFLGDAFLNIYFGLRRVNNKKACTMEAKLCPDGSAVGRVGANCEFAKCPDADSSKTVKIGSTITMQGVSITPLEVAEDSRCAVDVLCIWAGTVKLRVRLENQGEVQETVLDLGKSLVFKGSEVTLESINPSPRAKQTISTNQYVFSFLVNNKTAGWQTYVNVEDGFEFKFPKNFGAEIWRAFAWPPKVTAALVSENITKTGCPNIPDGTLFESNTVIINGVKYQLNQTSDAAAGSTYTTYCYVVRKDQKNYAIQFVIRYTSGCGESCGPYCETEHEAACLNFNKVKEVEEPIKQMISTFKFTEPAAKTRP